MATTPLCILLSISLLATGIGPLAATSGEVVPAVGASLADTSRLFSPQSGRYGRSTWSRRDPRLSQWGDQESAQELWARAVSEGARGPQSGAAVAPVADPNL